jgi:hypothetical protein
MRVERGGGLRPLQSGSLDFAACVFAQPKANSASSTCLMSSLPQSGRFSGRPFAVLTGLVEHLLQHVVLFVQGHELFQNDLAEALSLRRQTTEAVVDGPETRAWTGTSPCRALTITPTSKPKSV